MGIRFLRPSSTSMNTTVSSITNTMQVGKEKDVQVFKKTLNGNSPGDDAQERIIDAEYDDDDQNFRSDEFSHSADNMDTINSRCTRPRRQRRRRRRRISPPSDDTSSLDKGSENGTVTTRQYLVLSVLMIATLTSSLAVCLFPPFFPKIAEEKGCTASVYGFIIGTNCLASFILTPPIGKQLKNIGIRFALIMGMLTGGVCCFLSGFLEFFTPGYKFVVYAVIIRVIHAAGNAMVITATFTFTAVEFTESVGQVFSLTRTAMNVAQLFGPSVGGFIYGYGGFCMPFVVMGSIQVVMSLVSIPLLPTVKETALTQMNGERNRKKITVISMLRIPRIWFSFITFIAATACNGFLSINLEPQVLRNFDLTPFYIGLIFGLKDGANSIASPIWGCLCDRNRRSSVKPYIILSALFTAGSFFFLGAYTTFGLHWQQTLTMAIAALCLNGVGIGGEQVAGIVDALDEAVAAGYSNDPGMHGLIAGMWSSLSGAGRFISRAGSGCLVDNIGFDKTAALATGLQIFVAIGTGIYMVMCECRVRTRKSVTWGHLEEEESTSDSDEQRQKPNLRHHRPSIHPGQQEDQVIVEVEGGSVIRDDKTGGLKKSSNAAKAKTNYIHSPLKYKSDKKRRRSSSKEYSDGEGSSVHSRSRDAVFLEIQIPDHISSHPRPRPRSNTQPTRRRRVSSERSASTHASGRDRRNSGSNLHGSRTRRPSWILESGEMTPINFDLLRSFSNSFS